MSKLRDRRKRHDRFYKRAKREQFASRAIYKLEEIDKRFTLIRRGARVLDLGCWPGSWMQYAASKVGDGGRVVGIDRKQVELALPRQVVSVVGNVYEVAPRDLLRDVEAFDLVMSDMAPDTTGIRFTDATRSAALVTRALEIADQVSSPDAAFLAKILVGSDFDELLGQVKARYKRVKMVRPDGTRKESTEQYIVARERKPG